MSAGFDSVVVAPFALPPTFAGSASAGGLVGVTADCGRLGGAGFCPLGWKICEATYGRAFCLCLSRRRYLL